MVLFYLFEATTAMKIVTPARKNMGIAMMTLLPILSAMQQNVIVPGYNKWKNNMTIKGLYQYHILKRHFIFVWIFPEQLDIDSAVTNSLTVKHRQLTYKFSKSCSS